MMKKGASCFDAPGGSHGCRFFEETKENGNLFFPAGFVMLPADDEVEMQPDVLLLQLVGDLQIDF